MKKAASEMGEGEKKTAGERDGRALCRFSNLIEMGSTQDETKAKETLAAFVGNV